MQRDIKHTWFFECPAQLVWDHLTKKELLASWLMENDFEARVGHKFRFITYPRIKMGFDGIVHCEVLEIVPLQRLSYSWKGGPGNGKLTLDSLVTWTLIPRDGGTELTLVHSGFKGLSNFIPYLMMNSGWNGKIRKKLTDRLNAAK